jgi:imidazole glycerol-phosphate synthase subunit HisH
MQHKIAIVDYGVGNVHSVSAALTFLGYKNMVSRNPDVIREATALVLPGVGAYSQAVINLSQLNLIEVLNEEVLIKRKPILGICLGMQVLGMISEESSGFSGWGWIDAEVLRFPSLQDLRIPHVGWNTIVGVNDNFLFNNLEREPHFYFDHSYYFNCNDRFAIAKCNYGFPFTAAIKSDNIVGVQFHPEKSQTNGLKLFRNFCRYFGI